MLSESDLIGRRFGRLVIISRAYKNKQCNYMWKCKCDCGNETIVRYSALQKGNTKSCGCLNSELASKRQSVNLLGKIFNRLTVIEKLHKTKKGAQLWRCKCICGNEVISISAKLLNGHTKSCGCIKIIDLTDKRFGRLKVLHKVPSDSRYVLWRCLCDCGNETIVRGTSLRYGTTTSCGCNIIGSNSVFWKGGIAHEPYCPIWIDKEFKKLIKERDKNKCWNPYCKRGFTKRVLHHIDYNKKNCHPMNLITLCNSCNTRANTNREYWQELYENIMFVRNLSAGGFLAK